MYFIKFCDVLYIFCKQYVKCVFALRCFVNMCILVFVDFVTDFDFSPFDDYLLSSCSQDGTVSTFAYLIINRCSVL